VVFHQGELLPALAMADDCLARYHTGLHHPGAVQDPAVMCLCYSAWGLFEQGRADEAQRRIDKVLTLARALDHPFSLAVAQGFAASIALFVGRHEAGLAHAEQAVERCRAGAFQAWLAHALVVRGRLRAALGDAQAGLAEMEQGLQQWQRTGACITSATYLAFQAELLLDLDDPTEALRRLAQASDIAARCGERYHSAELLRLEGLARWRLKTDAGDAAAAQALLQQALDTAHAQGKAGFALRAAHALAGTWAAQGRADAAVALLDGALQAVPGHADTADATAARAALQTWGGSGLYERTGDAHATQ
jgi:tetratricopeptide (TPR) repeat protein